MAGRPGQSLPFGFEEAVNHERAAFGNIVSRLARGFSIFDRAARIDGCQRFPIRQKDTASIRDVTRINRAMAVA